MCSSSSPLAEHDHSITFLTTDYHQSSNTYSPDKSLVAEDSRSLAGPSFMPEGSNVHAPDTSMSSVINQNQAPSMLIPSEIREKHSPDLIEDDRAQASADDDLNVDNNPISGGNQTSSNNTPSAIIQATANGAKPFQSTFFPELQLMIFEYALPKEGRLLSVTCMNAYPNYFIIKPIAFDPMMKLCQTSRQIFNKTHPSLNLTTPTALPKGFEQVDYRPTIDILYLQRICWGSFLPYCLDSCNPFFNCVHAMKNEFRGKIRHLAVDLDTWKDRQHIAKGHITPRRFIRDYPNLETFTIVIHLDKCPTDAARRYAEYLRDPEDFEVAQSKLKEEGQFNFRFLEHSDLVRTEDKRKVVKVLKNLRAQFARLGKQGQVSKDDPNINIPVVRVRYVATEAGPCCARTTTEEPVGGT